MLGDKLKIFVGEEDMLVSHMSLFKYIKADREAIETSLQALEVAAISRKCNIKEP